MNVGPGTAQKAVPKAPPKRMIPKEFSGKLYVMKGREGSFVQWDDKKKSFYTIKGMNLPSKIFHNLQRGKILVFCECSD